MKPAHLARVLHKWLALFVGVQALLWTVSGFYMVVVDLDFIHGDTLVRNLTTPPPRAETWRSLNELRTRYADIEQIRIKGLPGFDRPLYEIKTAGGLVLADGITGEKISPIAEERIAQLARSYYAGSASLASVDLLVDDAPLEIQSRPLPLWRARFDDWLETTLYINPDSGELVTRRHRFWRWFDVFWMLHIMDYEARSDINNPLLRFSTSMGLIFAVSGLWLVYFSFRRRRARPTK
jgi:hypothetical protein